MMDLALKLALILACGTILMRVEPALNRMSRCTPWQIRYAMLLIAGGALLGMFGLLDGGSTDLSTVVLALGIAIFLRVDRRLRAFFPRPHHQGDTHA